MVRASWPRLCLSVDPAFLRRANVVYANMGWHDDICAMHGIDSELVDGLWRSRQSAPRLHSDAIVVESTVRVETIVGQLRHR